MFVKKLNIYKNFYKNRDFIITYLVSHNKSGKKV